MEPKRPGAPPVQIVFPGDNRQRVDPTLAQPYWWIGMFAIKFPNGDIGSGTGTLIGPRHVLTCAHNLFQNQRGGYAQAIQFFLARNGNTMPWQGVAPTKLFVNERYQKLSPPGPDQNGVLPGEITEYVEDFGLVRLAEDLNPANGLFPAMYFATDNELNNREWDIAGYPADKAPPYTMWNGSGKVAPDPESEDFLFYEISTYGGNSGSAVRSLLPNKNSPSIVGIHVGGVEMEIEATNLAVRLNPSVIKMINDWKKIQ